MDIERTTGTGGDVEYVILPNNEEYPLTVPLTGILTFQQALHEADQGGIGRKNAAAPTLYVIAEWTNDPTQEACSYCRQTGDVLMEIQCMYSGGDYLTRNGCYCPSCFDRVLDVVDAFVDANTDLLLGDAL